MFTVGSMRRDELSLVVFQPTPLATHHHGVLRGIHGRGGLFWGTRFWSPVEPLPVWNYRLVYVFFSPEYIFFAGVHFRFRANAHRKMLVGLRENGRVRSNVLGEIWSPSCARSSESEEPRNFCCPP